MFPVVLGYLNEKKENRGMDGMCAGAEDLGSQISGNPQRGALER